MPKNETMKLKIKNYVDSPTLAQPVIGMCKGVAYIGLSPDNNEWPNPMICHDPCPWISILYFGPCHLTFLYIHKGFANKTAADQK